MKAKRTVRFKGKLQASNAATPTAPTPPPAAAIVLAGELSEDQIPKGGPLETPGAPPPLKSFIEIVRSKFCPVLRADAPEWAKRAAERVFSSVFPPSRRKKATEHYEFGFSAGQLSAASDLLASALPSASDLDEFERKWAAMLPSDQAAEFFVGLRDGEHWMRAVPERANGMAERTRAMHRIASDWSEAQKCEGNAGQLHRWLIEKGATGFRTDPAATRKICRLIGFPMREQSGRPPLQE